MMSHNVHAVVSLLRSTHGWQLCQPDYDVITANEFVGKVIASIEHIKLFFRVKCDGMKTSPN